MDKTQATPENAGTILIADDDQAVRFVLERALSHAGYSVQAFPEGRSLLQAMEREPGDMVITDIVMPTGSGLDLLKELKAKFPDLPVIVITAQSTLLNAVNAFERGAFDYLPKPFDIKKVLDLVAKGMAERQPRPQPAAPAKAPRDADRFGGIVGSSQAMQELFRTIGRLASSEMTVLIHGESGSGKELVARAIHSHSPRREGPFTAINMAAIPRDLIESELFGHEKGAFTGAAGKKSGHFETAEKGTLFLDEIGDMPMEAQTRLLRVLQDGAYTRVGGAETLRSNVRILAATHQDLPNAIRAGRFREDLFYRLNVIPIFTPSLRQRREDIPLLANFFVSRTAQELEIPPKQFTMDAMRRLMEYDWPGNVRELENLVRRLMVLVPGELIEPDRLELAPRQARPPTLAAPTADGQALLGEPRNSASSGAGSLEEAVTWELDRYFATLKGLDATDLYQTIIRQVEKPLLIRTLRETRGNQLKASKLLGINRNTLRKKLRDLEIDPKS